MTEALPEIHVREEGGVLTVIIGLMHSTGTYALNLVTGALEMTIDPLPWTYLPYKVFKLTLEASGKEIFLTRGPDFVYRGTVDADTIEEYAEVLRARLRDEDGAPVETTFLHEDRTPCDNVYTPIVWVLGRTEVVPVAIEVCHAPPRLRIYEEARESTLSYLHPVLLIRDRSDPQVECVWWAICSTVIFDGQMIYEIEIKPAFAALLQALLSDGCEDNVSFSLLFADPERFTRTLGEAQLWNLRSDIDPWHYFGWKGPRVELRPSSDASDLTDWPEGAAERVRCPKRGPGSELLDEHGYAYFDSRGWPLHLPERYKVTLPDIIRAWFHSGPAVEWADWNAEDWARCIWAVTLTHDCVPRDAAGAANDTEPEA